MSYVIVDGVTVSVNLVGSTAPRPVQVVLDGLSAGQTVVVSGTAGGHSWAVPGGAFEATGEQVVLVDTRAAINTPVVYTVVVDGVTITSPQVVVDYPSNFLIQSLDGRTVVACKHLAGGLVREPVVRSAVFDVPGRARPPVRFAAGGDGSSSVSVLTDPQHTVALRELVRTGRPLVIRSSGYVPDVSPTEIVLVTAAPHRLTGAGDRVWDMAFLFVDDPEPGTPVSAFTWSDFDAAWDGQTWADFDAFFDGLTWDAFDRMDWTELG